MHPASVDPPVNNSNSSSNSNSNINQQQQQQHATSGTTGASSSLLTVVSRSSSRVPSGGEAILPKISTSSLAFKACSWCEDPLRKPVILLTHEHSHKRFCSESCLREFRESYSKVP